ncbi:MAG: alpha/beta fold hydrolase [Peptostreptococcaceae bacterium]|nr:alpha/beta fold hydrolase [Peptostreptococcaceae bacterium]
MQGYEKDDTWRAIRTFLPESVRLHPENMPSEYFLKLGRFHVHIDHYDADRVSARVILLHGAGGNGRLMSSIALPLQRAGIEVTCPDLPLYGHTEYIGGITYEDWIECGRRLVWHYQRKDDKKTFLMGLSVGGMLACHIAAVSQNISGIIATCLLDQHDDEVLEQIVLHPLFAKVGRPAMAIFNKAFGGLRFPMKWVSKMNAISNFDELNKILLKDKTSSGVAAPLSFLYSLTSPKDRIRPEDFSPCPILLAHPGADRWTDIALSRKFFDRLKGEKEMVILEGAGHFPIEELGAKQLEEAGIRFIKENL